MKKILSVAICFMSFVATSQETGTIAGVLTDKEANGKALAFANVLIKGTRQGTISNMDGLYKIKDIEPGTYTVVFSYVGYKTLKVPGVEIVAGKVTEIDAGLQASAAVLDEVVITSVAREDSEVALLLEQKGAIQIKESIGSVELAKLGISNVATATTKIAGVSASEASGNIYVRGLGDRYLSTTMNGLPIPSDDVNRKNIDLELFPTRVIKSISIRKTYSVQTSADQVSGNIDIKTRELVGKSELGAGVSIGINTNSLQEGVYANFKQTPNIEGVNVGFYSKEIPTREALIQQPWDPRSVSVPINYKYSVTAGKRFGEKFELLFTAAHDVEFNYREGVYRQYRANNLQSPDDFFDDVREWTTTYENSALLNLGYQFNDNHKIQAVSLFINKLTDKVYEAGRAGNGFVFEETPPSDNLSQFVRDQNTKQTRLWVNQLLGDHQFGENNTLNWAVGYNLVNADEPNRIRNEVNFNKNIIELGNTGGFQQRKTKQLIEDRELNARIEDNFTIFKKDSTALNLIVGGYYRNKERDFASQFFGVQETGSNDLNPVSLDNLTSVFTQENLENGLIRITALEEDTYNALLESTAGFLVANYKFGKFNINVGARYQRDELNVDYVFGNLADPSGTVEKSYGNIYPAINLKYSLNKKHNFRIAASKTITLPEFKEISPFEYVSPTGDVLRGNPDLEASNAYNLDIKWEFFPTPQELISLTGFYKRIEDPINLVQTRGSAGVFSYFNAGNLAEVYGLELDANLSLLTSENGESPELGVGLNASRMWHLQDLKENRDAEGNLLNTFRYKGLSEIDLQGASDWIFNAALKFTTNTENEFLATVSANYASEKVYALGAPEIQTQSEKFYNDAIIEDGFVTLNALLNQELGEHLELEFKAKNILNPEVKRTQLVNPLSGPETNQTVRSYKKGVTLSLGLSYDF